jgi:hypothetical protein
VGELEIWHSALVTASGMESIGYMSMLLLVCILRNGATFNWLLFVYCRWVTSPPSRHDASLDTLKSLTKAVPGISLPYVVIMQKARV